MPKTKRYEPGEEKIAEAMISSNTGKLTAIHTTSDGESVVVQAL